MQTEQQKELRILILEDSPFDAELMEHVLRKDGLAFTSMRVDTREAFVHALEEFKPDLIISDYHLPGFDGLTALKTVRQSHPGVPVIMVTGALPDIEAVEFIHAGAKDYILKDRLARLAPAVQRVL
ncbi:MAG: response regulator, partial [Gallionellaceae bacterium]|nr:response regulator [Gallionellaceae bacterium]